MFRYLALIWDPAQQQPQATTAELTDRMTTASWQRAVSHPGLAVFHSGSRQGSSAPHLLHAGAGAVLGRLFAGGAAAPTQISAWETDAIVRSGGQRLVDGYWGRYVAFIRDATRQTTRVLRDPSAGMPCLHARFGGVQVFFSNMEDALALGLGPFPVDMSYLAAHLCQQILEVHSSALQGVARVLPGECVEIGRGGIARHLLWNPLHVAAGRPLEDPAAAAVTLGHTVRECVHAWASGHDSIVHTLSGGLDSSIVLACLRDAPARPRLACVNYHSPGANSDERGFARQVAEQAGCELTERERDPSIRLEQLLQAPRSAYPVNNRYYLENSAWEAGFAARRQATALFCGEGGDQIFYQARVRFAAGDYLLRRGRLRGLGPGLFRVALDVARLDRLSVWTVLADALAQGWLGRRWQVQSDIGRYRKLVPDTVLAQVKSDTRFHHPAFQHPARSIGSGKRWHAYQLLFPAMDYYDPLGMINDAERITPLASQPVLELCLRTPIDVLTTGGWDRAVARRAFRPHLPRQVALRRTKGGLDAYFKNVVLANMDFVRPFLLEGRLAAQGLLDRARLEAVLSGEPNRIGADTTELFDCVNLEAWLHRWERPAAGPAIHQPIDDMGSAT